MLLSLRGYQSSWLRGDLIARAHRVGVLVGVVLTLYSSCCAAQPDGTHRATPTEDDTDVLVARAPDVTGCQGSSCSGSTVPSYTANIRPANDKIVAAVDKAEGTQLLLLDLSAVGELTLTVMDEMSNLAHVVDERSVALWLAVLPPGALATARLTPRWDELHRKAGSPTTLAAVHAYRGR